MNSDSVLNDDFLAASPHTHAFLAHEVRNLVNVAILSFEVLKTTGAGVAGDKGQVLRRSLNDLRTLINRSLSDMRTGHGRDVITIGTISARNLPGQGCVFTIDVPRLRHPDPCAVRDSDGTAFRR